MAENVIYGHKPGDNTATTSTIDGLLKEHYVMREIQNTVNMQTYFLSKLTMEKAQYGRRFVFPVQFGIGEGQGNRDENVALPDPGFGEYDQAFGNVRFQYGSMYITGPAIESTSGSRASFASALKQALKDVRDGYKLDTHRQSWGDEDGVIARTGDFGSTNNITVTAATDVTLPLKDPYGLEYDEGLEANEKHVLFRRGMQIRIVGTSNYNQVWTVKGKKTNGNIVLAGKAGESTEIPHSATIYRGDAASDAGSNRNKDFLGITAMVKTTGTYLGIDRTDEVNWQANQIDIGSSNLTEDHLQQAFDTAEIMGDGMMNPNLLISNHKVRRLYVNLLEDKRRYVEPMNLRGGYKALSYNGEPWVVDKICPPERIYYLHTPDICWFYMKRIGWLQKDGTILKWVDNRDAWRAVLASYRNLACKKPANQTVLSGVNS